MKFGFTFSQKYAKELGLNWKTTLKQLLSEIDFNSIRLCAYWDDIEPKKGEFKFQDLDWQIQEASRSGLDIILSLGRKVPRWPEYHEPLWAINKDRLHLNESLTNYIERLIDRYKKEVSIKYWQIENEPFFNFGNTNFPLDSSSLEKEINTVKSKDNRPVLITDSGEHGYWRDIERMGDIIGINLYSITYDGGYKQNQLPADFYRKKKNEIRKDIIVSELQAEPWGPSHVKELSRKEQKKSMNPYLFRKNVSTAIDAGFKESLLWGAEWWLLLSKEGNNCMMYCIKDVVNA